MTYAFQRNPKGRFKFTTVIYSTPKKGGKTTIGGAVCRWAAETWEAYGEVLCIGNDADQARERAFAKLKMSIEQTPGFNKKKDELPGEWRLRHSEAICLSNGTRVKAIATDYQGEAGANPTLTVWTELWGFIHRDDLRFWAEMGPSPTRQNSIRFIETYAGYEGQSELLESIYKSVVIDGRQLTAGELLEFYPDALGAFEEAPNHDSLVPCWVNETARIFAYWDSGDEARRMPWQKGEDGRAYYATEESLQSPSQMLRLHGNLWISAESAFIPIEWWDACLNPLPLVPGEKTPLVVALDAAVSGDSFAIVVVSRDPNNPKEGIAIRTSRKWEPSAGSPIDYKGPWDALVAICTNFNVKQIAYDPYQLHDFATRFQREHQVWCRSFGQGKDRLIADFGLYTLIAKLLLRHDGDLDMRSHIANANAKHSKDEDTRLRLIKKSESRKIDLAVALSMGAHECLRLNL